VLWPHLRDPPDDVVEMVAAAGLQLRRGSTVLLGAMFGCDDAVTLTWMDEEVHSHTRLFDALKRDDMPCQIAALLLRVCALPRVGYLARVLPPALTTRALEVFDDMVMTTMAAKCGVPRSQLDEVSSQQIRLPVRLAGLGLRSHAATAPLSYLSSLALAAPDVLRAKANGQEPLLPTLRTDAAVSDCYHRIRPTGYFARRRAEDKVQLPTESADFLDAFQEGGATGLQHVLLNDIETASFDELLFKADRETKARLRCCSETGAGAWITAVPTEDELSMSDGGYRGAVRLRLGLPPSNHMPSACFCGTPLTYRHHFLVCQKLKATASTTRHDRLVRAFAELALEAGACVIVEPNSDGKRPDAEIVWAEETDLVDVSVAHVGASAVQSLGTDRGQLRSAKARAARKTAAYAAVAREANATFVPLVLETFGAFAEDTRNYVSKLNLALLSSAAGRNLPDQTGRMMQRLAVTLQNGNARVQEEGLRRARAAAVGEWAPRPLRRAGWQPAISRGRR
jgi:hypothetical protein